MIFASGFPTGIFLATVQQLSFEMASDKNVGKQRRQQGAEFCQGSFLPMVSIKTKGFATTQLGK